MPTLNSRRLLPCTTTLVALATTFAAVASPQEPPASDAAKKFPYRMNTVGFLPEAVKLVTVTTPGVQFKVVRKSDGQEVLTGTSSAATRNADTGEDLAVIDISELTETGTFRIQTDGLGASPEFNVGPDVYNKAFYTVFRGMYLWRCGTAVSGEHDGRHYGHEACHVHDALTDFIEDEGRPRDATGGWHDAGDYNKYIVNAGITVGIMLQAWEHHHDRLTKLIFNIPESPNDVPDYLDEIRWEMDWVLKTQLADGSVSHKVSNLNFGGFIAPEDEQEPRYFVPWSSAATADFVAMTAASARAFRDYDKRFSDSCLAAAKKSYTFLLQHPEEHRANQKGFATGGYGAPDPDDRLWAAAELWETTGENECLIDFENQIRNQIERNDERLVVDFNWDWGDVSNLAVFTYILSNRNGRDPEIVAKLQDQIIAVADDAVATSDSHGYGRTLGSRYYWGANGTVARMAMVLEIANRLKPDARYNRAAMAAIDHLFGRNCYGRSFVTGLGFQPPMFPHDRRNGINGFPEPWPGYLVGGPWPKASDWHDEQNNYRTNEIAINWNGALIYALAKYIEPSSFPQVASSN